MDRQSRQKTDESRVKILVLLLGVRYKMQTAITHPGHQKLENVEQNGQGALCLGVQKAS